MLAKSIQTIATKALDNIKKIKISNIFMDLLVRAFCAKHKARPIKR